MLSAKVGVLKSGLLGSYLDIMFAAIFLMAFHGFMRCGEFTSPTTTFQPDQGLALSDVVIRGEGASQVLYINLRFSKMDPNGHGVVIRLFPLPTELCPVQAMDKYMQARVGVGTMPAGPFFMMPNGAPLTRTDFVTSLQQVLQCIGASGHIIKPHSFRIGAATAAAQAGVPDHIIKMLGRWSSDSYQRYIRTSSTVLASAHQAIAQLR
jgi:hypothetical protein